MAKLELPDQLALLETLAKGEPTEYQVPEKEHVEAVIRAYFAIVI